MQEGEGPRRPVEPRATYRLQLRPGFGFGEAQALLPYLDRLGVSHLYLSPCLQAVPGSEHGYDVADPSRVSADLGGRAGLENLAAEAHRRGMGVLLDIVPNHMATDAESNLAWRDVLEDGQRSPYAPWFDIDWTPPQGDLAGRVLLPVLDAPVTEAIAGGRLRLERDGGDLWVRHHGRVAPVAPATVGDLLDGAGSHLSAAAWLSRRLPDGGQPRLQARREVRTAIAGAPAAELARFDQALIALDGPAIERVLDLQPHRLAFWREASGRLNWRRFFTVSSLVGVRVEDPEVFDATHACIVDLVRAGVVDGLRIDHIDGLRDPAGYLRRLREASGGCWTVVEKILEGVEELPAGWAADGTTGYEFAARVEGLLVDPDGEPALTALWRAVAGAPADFASIAEESRRELLAGELRPDVERVAHRLHQAMATAAPLEAVRQGVVEVLSVIPVYRTYADPQSGAVTPEDAAVGRLVVATLRAAGRVAPAVCDTLEDLLTGGAASLGAAALDALARLQQLSPAVVAKGVEDTALYRHHRLAALGEVGADPSRLGMPAEAFHAACARTRPHTLVATATHDTKRGEDVRARLCVLSEVAADFASVVGRWREHNARHRRDGAPDGPTEHLLYQTLVGCWPLERERCLAYITKAGREAKRRTSWTDPDEDYERGVSAFVEALYADSEFLAELEAFAAPLAIWGRLGSLAQVLLRATVPGVCDTYQGTELWDLSLVDPDNRRPVDFALRARLLDVAVGADAAAVAARMEEGLPKLRVLAAALDLRRRRPEAFGRSGAYRPLPVEGPGAGHVVAFVRGAPEAVAVVARRHALAPPGGLGDTVVDLPTGVWRDVLTGAGAQGWAALDGLLGLFGVALLERVA